jgi:hypothetical protein
LKSCLFRLSKGLSWKESIMTEVILSRSVTLR